MALSIQYPAETSSARRVKRMTGSHNFEIMGYSTDYDIGKGEYYKSSCFSVGGYEWCMKYYPNGSNEAVDDYMSIFIVLESQAEDVKAQVSFILLDQSGNDVISCKSTKIRTFNTFFEWGYDSFAKRELLESTIKDDCFLIKCVLTVFKVMPVQQTEPILVPPRNIHQQLGNLLETGIGADVTFEVNGTKFSAHKCILAARSPVFSAQFFGPMKEKSGNIIMIEEMEAPVFKALLHFIYTDSFSGLEEIKESEAAQDARLMAELLLVAADRYGLDRLKIACEKILADATDRSNVASMLFLADRHSCIHLKAVCFKFITNENILVEIAETKEFQNLVRNDPSVLIELLSFI